MPLDPQTKTMLEQMEAIGAPPLWKLDVADARASMTAMISMMGPGEEVRSVEDRTIDADGQRVPIRIYRPAGLADGPAPVLVFYHGGGFVLGDLESHDRDCRALANRGGCVVVAVDYRLAPEHPFPAAVDDAAAALSWVVSHADELGIDPDRVAVGGDSAGGNLAAVTALWARDAGIGLRLQLLIYPVVDFSEGDYPSRTENATGFMLDEQSMQWFVDHYAHDTERTEWRLTPMLAERHDGLAPALVITAEFDPLRDEGEAYGAKLVAAGVPATVTRYDGLIHGFFGMGAVIPAARPAVDEAGAALRTALSD
jgi:acetyl esterase